MAPPTSGVRPVSTLRDARCVVAVTARAHARQLLTRPWANVLGWPALLTWTGFAAVALPWHLPPYRARELGLFAEVAVVAYGVVMLGVAAMTAAAIGLVLVVHPAFGRRTSYLLTSPAGKACVLLRGTNTSLWEATALAASPPRRGLGTELGNAVLREADTAGATVQLWCTPALEQLYARQGFGTVRRRFGMRLMRREPATPS